MSKIKGSAGSGVSALSGGAGVLVRMIGLRDRTR